MPAWLLFRLRDFNLPPPSAATRKKKLSKPAEAHAQKLGNALVSLQYSKL